jgi:hypothetical protein
LLLSAGDYFLLDFGRDAFSTELLCCRLGRPILQDLAGTIRVFRRAKEPRAAADGSRSDDKISLVDQKILKTKPPMWLTAVNPLVYFYQPVDPTLKTGESETPRSFFMPELGSAKEEPCQTAFWPLWPSSRFC